MSEADGKSSLLSSLSELNKSGVFVSWISKFSRPFDGCNLFSSSCLSSVWLTNSSIISLSFWSWEDEDKLETFNSLLFDVSRFSLLTSSSNLRAFAPCVIIELLLFEKLNDWEEPVLLNSE